MSRAKKKQFLPDDKGLQTNDTRSDEPPDIESDDDVERESIDSSPASDPPAFTPAHAENPTALPFPRNPQTQGPNQRRLTRRRS